MTKNHFVWRILLSVSVAGLARLAVAKEPDIAELKQTRFKQAEKKALPALPNAAAPPPAATAPTLPDTNQPPASAATAVPAGAATAVPAGAPLACELKLYVEQKPGGKPGFSIPDNTLGVAVVEPTDADSTTYIDGVCIKHVGEPLQLPASMQVASPGGDGLSRFCSDSDAEKGATIAGIPVKVCTWNGAFHSPRPFTFTLVSAPGHTVAEYVEFVRVYRNASLMAAWNKASDSHPGSQVVISGSMLRSRFFAASQPPNGAPLDIRVIPVGTTIAGTVDTIVRNDPKELEQRLANAGKAAANEVLPPDSPARKSLECLKTAVLHDVAQIVSVVRSPSGLPNFDPGCDLPLGVTMGTPLSDAYSNVKSQGKEALLQLQSEANQKLEQFRQALEKNLPPYVTKEIEEGAKAAAAALSKDTSDKVAAYLKANPDNTVKKFLESERAKLNLNPTELTDLNTLEKTIVALTQDANTQVTFALRQVDEAEDLAKTLYSKASDIASDPKQQADLFNAVAQSLQSQGDVFEATRDNPPLLAGEQKFPMTYADPWQGFMFAPWNGVPVRIGTDGKADLNAGVAIPIIDLVGIRYQWDSTRFADIRGALGAAYTSTKVNGVDESAFMPTVSLGLSTLKLGFGLVVGPSESKFGDRARMIVGADLYKLISGNDVEAL